MKNLFLLLSALAFSHLSFSQYYYLEYDGDTPEGLNQDTCFFLPPGWTSIIGPYQPEPIWSADQTIPFAFDFNGESVSDYKVSSTGVLTFTMDADPVPGLIPSALPHPEIPDKSICLWGLNVVEYHPKLLGLRQIDNNGPTLRIAPMVRFQDHTTQLY